MCVLEALSQMEQGRSHGILRQASPNNLEKDPTKEYYCQLCYKAVRFKVPMVDKRRTRLTHEGPWMMH